MRQAGGRTILLLAFMVLLLALTSPLASCGGSGDDAGTKTPATAQTAAVDLSQEEIDRILRDRANVVFSSVGGASSEYPDNLMTAEQLLSIIQDPRKADDIFILDTRPRNEWEEQGHIKGATWIKMQEVAEPENLAKLPMDKLIVCVSPTGHTANQVTTVLRWLGYEAVLLEHGMAGWIQTPARDLMLTDVEGGITRRWPVAFEEPYTVQEPQDATMALTQPTGEEFEVLAQAARDFLHDDVLEKEYPFNHIFAETVYERLNDPVRKDSLFLLDIRPLSSWQSIGHIDIGQHLLINWRVLGQPENLAKLPTDKLIVVIGDTGQTAGQVTPVLRMLGYDAVTMRSGMTAWTGTPDSQDSLAAFQRELPVEE